MRAHGHSGRTTLVVGMACGVAIFVNFLIFAQFGYLERLRHLGLGAREIQVVLGIMGAAGLATSLLTPLLIRRRSPLFALRLGLLASLLVTFFFHTPVDETHTTGTMFQYRSFLNQPGLKQGFNWLFERLTRKAIAEDGELMRSQMLNAAKGARSTAAYYFDAVLARYYKWQKRRESDDLWFRGFDHERARHGERGGVHLPIVPPEPST